MTGPLIVTAEMAGPDQAWLDRLRRAHFPPERNHLSAHLTIFHALPPFTEEEAKQRLSVLAREAAPEASIEGLMNLGGGVAFRVVSPRLDEIRAELQNALHGLLTTQDSGGWRPHVTIQNKVTASEARTLLDQMNAGFAPRPLGINELALHRYCGGPWEPIASYPFQGRR